MNEKKHFFTECPKCNHKIFEHQGYIETEKGTYTFAVKCDKCGNQFEHKRLMGGFTKPPSLKEMAQVVKEVFNA